MKGSPPKVRDHNRVLFLLGLVAIVLPCWSHDSKQIAAASRPEEVVVTGERPGPGLWTVSDGDSTLYILGTYSPLPKHMTWRSRQVISVISRSQEVLGPYTVTLQVSQSAPQLTPHAPLKDVLPRHLYARWRRLAIPLLPGNSTAERLLPSQAALVLRTAALDQHGLTDSGEVWRSIYASAAKYSVPVRSLEYPINYARSKLPRRSRRQEIRFLERTIVSFDADLELARDRATAWANGNVTLLRSLAISEEERMRTLSESWPYLTRKDALAVSRWAEERLIWELRGALQRNEVTFAALPIYVLLGSDNILSRLRDDGLIVTDPQ